MSNFHKAVVLYEEMIKEGWVDLAAKNEASISYPLTLKEQNKIWKLKPQRK
jgi:hypothetical protein